MGSKKSPTPKDAELQNAVITLLESGDDTGCQGTVVVNVEEFLRVQSMIEDRTGETFGSVSDDNTCNHPDDEEFVDFDDEIDTDEEFVDTDEEIDEESEFDDDDAA